jgi:hypothetical protein
MIAPPDPRWPGQPDPRWPAGHDPRWPTQPHHGGWWGWPRPVRDNQLGWRMPSGGQPAASSLPLLIALGLFILSPLILFSWAAAQAVLRWLGWRWWKAALLSLAALVLVIVVQGGPGPALAHHFSGYLWILRQFGHPVIHLPFPGALVWPQVPLSVPLGALAAALNVAGRRQPFHPAEVRRQQREHRRHMTRAIARAGSVNDDHFGQPALGAALDGDLGLAARDGLVYLPGWISRRSRLLLGTSGMGKSVDVEREAFLSARAGRKFVLIDGKGTDPGFAERALAGYLAGNPHARVGLWPELPMDGWRGTPAAVHNRLMAMLGWSEPYYKDIASLLLRLALTAPTQDGPVRTSAQLLRLLDPEVLRPLWEHDPERARQVESLRGREQARAVTGAVSRFANFFHAVGEGFDAAELGWSFEDVDFAYLRAPYLAGREDADAACRLLLEDFAHYATLRKPRRGEDVTLVFDEFSAIGGGREVAIQLVERIRDAGCAVVLSAQSADGLGDEAQQRRLVGACAGGLLLHAMPNPDGMLRAAGVVQVVEQTWRLDQHGPTGNSSARLGEQPKIQPGQVQQAREGEGWLIARGRYQHLIVTRTRIAPATRDRAHAMIALARSLRPDQPLPGARSWTEVQETAGVAALAVERHLAIEPPPPQDRAAARLPDLPPGLIQGGKDREDQDQAHEPQAPDGPVDGAGWRLRLAVASAAREGDAEQVTALIHHATSLGLAEAMLAAVARAHWPPAAFPLRACRAGLRWLRARARRARPGRANRAVVER